MIRRLVITTVNIAANLHKPNKNNYRLSLSVFGRYRRPVTRTYLKRFLCFSLHPRKRHNIASSQTIASFHTLSNSVSIIHPVIKLYIIPATQSLNKSQSSTKDRRFCSAVKTCTAEHPLSHKKCTFFEHN